MCKCKNYDPSEIMSVAKKSKPSDDPEFSLIESQALENRLEHTIVAAMDSIVNKYLNMSFSGGLKRWKEKKSGKKIDFNREIFVRVLVCTYAYKSDCNARIRIKTDFQENKIVVEWYRYSACHGMVQSQPRFLFFDDHESFQHVRLKRGGSNETSSIDLPLEISEELV